MGIIWGCGGNKSHPMTVTFPNEADASKAATKTIKIYSIIPQENATCDDLVSGAHNVGEEGYLLEKEVDVQKPFAKIDLKIKNDSGARLFFIEGADDNDQLILRVAPTLIQLQPA